MLGRGFALPVVALVVSLAGTTQALAAGQRTFVASYGDDGNPCTLQLPCRAFRFAIPKTNPGGEVVVLDSAGYGPVTITQSVSIIAPPGVYAGMSPFPGEDGVTVAAAANDKVVLRGLTINGQGGNRGIVVSSGGEVHIENCTVANMGLNGIEITGGGHVHLRSSVVRGNGWSGLVVAASSATVQVSDTQFARHTYNGIQVIAGTLEANRIAADDNAIGVFLANPSAGAQARVTLSDSVVSGNSNAGAIVQTSIAGSTARMAIVRSTSTGNANDGFGAYSVGGIGTAILLVSDSTAFRNGYGLAASGAGATAIGTRSTFAFNTVHDVFQGSSAVLRTAGNNTLTGTGADTSGSFAPNPLF